MSSSRDAPLVSLLGKRKALEPLEHVQPPLSEFNGALQSPLKRTRSNVEPVADAPAATMLAPASVQPVAAAFQAPRAAPSALAQQQGPTHRPASASTTALTVPSNPRAQHQVDASEMLQPIMQLRPGLAHRKQTPEHFSQLVDQRSAVIAEKQAVKHTSVETLSEFRKFTGTSSKVKRSATDILGGLGGANQGGLYPTNEQHRTADLPSHVDYTQHRPAQMLSQLSEVMLHGAKAADLRKSPVEIQFGYGIKDGELSVFASANNAETQNWLASAMAAPPGAHLQRAAKSDDPETQLMASKLLFHDEQQQQRHAAIQDHPHQPGLKHDLDLASAIRDKFLSRDITVIKNPKGRHAEQNIGTVMHHQGMQHGDIQGSKIRCHACRGALGSNLQDEHGVGLSGKVYTSQEAPERFETNFQSLKAGSEKIVTAQPQRPRALSFSSLPAYKPASD